MVGRNLEVFRNLGFNEYDSDSIKQFSSNYYEENILFVRVSNTELNVL